MNARLRLHRKPEKNYKIEAFGIRGDGKIFVI